MPRTGTKVRSRGGVAPAPGSSRSHATLTLRVELGKYGRLGPGKVRLLELIQEHGSIAAAGRAMGMSYRRAWLLVDGLNQTFRQPLVATQHGGAGGGRAELTAFGHGIVRRYREMEDVAERTAARHLRALTRALAAAPPALANNEMPDDDRS